jgi:hypothetical protein
MALEVPPPATNVDIGLTCLDSDGDGIRNTAEITFLGTNPADADSDHNGVADGVEDADDDGLSNAEEITAMGTNPLNPDSDSDGLSDGVEVHTHRTNALLPDTDLDGCRDPREVAALQSQGGSRNPNYSWDFFDVPAPAGPTVGTDGRLILSASASRNNVVSLQDVAVVLSYVGRTASNAYYTGDNNSDGIDDGKQLDRTPSIVPGQLWRSGAPNGAISLQDVGVALAQVGHNCSAP